MSPINEEWLDIFNENIALYKELTRVMLIRLNNIVEQENIDCALDVQGREKGVISFLEKMERKQYENPIREMTDWCGIRLVLYYEDDVRDACRIIEDSFNVDYDNTINKKEQLGVDKFGYCGMNYVVSLLDDDLELPEYEAFIDKKFEIQILTLSQYVWSEIQRKIEYKSEDLISVILRRRLSMISALFELADIEFQYLKEKGIEELLEYPISLRSLRIYILKSKILNDFLKSCYREGIVNEELPEIDIKLIDEIYESCQLLNFEKISSIHELLLNNDLINNLKQAIIEKGLHIRIGSFTIVLFLIYYSNDVFNEAYLLERGWPVEIRDLLNDRPVE